MEKAVNNYKTYVNDQTEQLVKTTTTFTDAVKAGDLEKAKASYAEARVYYERIEPIAESFGDLDPKLMLVKVMLTLQNGEDSIALKKQCGKTLL
ncbi:EfeM/EfeO family lipoprotein [Priestia megaterium]